MMFKPKWYLALPETVKPVSNQAIRKIERWRTANEKYGYSHDKIFQIIMCTRWAVRRIQYSLLRDFARMAPNADKQDSWAAVLMSRLEVKHTAARLPNHDPYVKPMSSEKILELMNDVRDIAARFKSFDEVVDYIVSLDESENRYHDISGIFAEVEALLNET